MTSEEFAQKLAARQTAILAAKHFVEGVDEQDWPEDEWFTLDDNWDLNLWTEEDEDGLHQRAAVYPVVNGRTDTATFFSIR